MLELVVPSEVDSYLARREREAEEIQERAVAGQRDLSGIRERLLARRKP